MRYQNDTVYYTTNLEMFKPMDHNRVKSKARIKEIAKSMEDEGLLKVPIIVNRKKQIIDGQHRFEAAKIAGKGLYFITANKYGEDEMMSINKTMKNWSKNDYLSHYVSKGNKNYVKLMEFRKEYPIFSLTDSCIFLKGGLASGMKKEVFSEGRFKAGSMDKARMYADFILSLEPFAPKIYYRTVFVRTMLSVLNKYSTVEDSKSNFKNKEGSFVMSEFMKKAEIVPHYFKLCGDKASYSRMIEDIYNFKRRTDKKIFIRV
jgi:hypothetical protein|tara:strand:- start:8294 stop:9073 length:780 start_codon:yes stop_codon:yes gene_type:complete